MPPSSQDLEAKRDQMIQQFEKYREQVSEAFDEVLDALNKGEYARACKVMSAISQHQGQTSVNMRTVLVRNGFLVRGRSE